MDSSIQLKKSAPLFVIALLLTCLALSPRAQAVSPPPDGGYPRGNTAKGTDALFSLTTGISNTTIVFKRSLTMRQVITIRPSEPGRC